MKIIFSYKSNLLVCNFPRMIKTLCSCYIVNPYCKGPTYLNCGDNWQLWISPKWHLTQWGRDKMAEIFQTIFSKAISWMKMFEFWIQFDWSLFLRVQLTTRYVDGTPMSEVTPVTIRYICPPHHGHTSQYHGHEWMTYTLFVSCQLAVPFLR